MEAKTKTIRLLMKHAEIQSLLDIKAMFGEFSAAVFERLEEEADRVIVFSDKTPYACFWFVQTDNGHNMYSLLTPKAEEHREYFEKSLVNQFPDGKIEAIIYNGNKKLYNILKSVGFSFIKEIKTGVENRSFNLMSRG